MKPFADLTPKEMASLRKHLMKLAGAEHLFPGYLGNKNSFFIAKPLPRRRRKVVKKAKEDA
ncbi:MAG: hypothetical protein K9N47_13175 [Prosthecobacter sp.]|uniref:hypothetical protein n=1 Tax=Prosthecobacter sp. TaxID=1965333 RepID=UPI0025EF687B|nr:hypothetical protein [Prosthecobacter sp.]MCF7787071.1 hypothetical protein [Prosthecobacter sp.]